MKYYGGISTSARHVKLVCFMRERGLLKNVLRVCLEVQFEVVNLLALLLIRNCERCETESFEPGFTFIKY